MKKIIFILLFTCAIIQDSNAQDKCNPFFSIKKGLQWTTVMKFSTNKKAYNMKRDYRIKKVKNEDGKIKIEVEIAMYGPKGKSIVSKDFSFYYCINGEFRKNLAGLTGAMMLGVSKKQKEESVLNGLAYPAELKVAQELNGGSLRVEEKALITIGEKNGLTTTIKNRVVESKEQITTPIGTFEAYKITALVSLNINGQNADYNIVEYIAKDNGIVKTELYDTKGNLVSEEEMIEFNN